MNKKHLIKSKKRGVLSLLIKTTVFLYTVFDETNQMFVPLIKKETSWGGAPPSPLEVKNVKIQENSEQKSGDPLQ